MAHEHQQVFPATIARTVQTFVKMFVTRIQVMRLGRQKGRAAKLSGRCVFRKSFNFLHHAFGDPLGDEHRLAFQRGGQRRAPRAEFMAEIGGARHSVRCAVLANPDALALVGADGAHPTE